MLTFVDAFACTSSHGCSGVCKRSGASGTRHCGSTAAAAAAAAAAESGVVGIRAPSSVREPTPTHPTKPRKHVIVLLECDERYQN